jgi:hypothetical protein
VRPRDNTPETFRVGQCCGALRAACMPSTSVLKGCLLSPVAGAMDRDQGQQTGNVPPR